MTRAVSIALVHWPVKDQQGAEVTSAITNLDVHDLARSARTYGCGAYYIVHPIDAQRELVRRICSHWLEGSSGRRIPDRKEALALVRPVPSLEVAWNAMGGRDALEIWVTAARLRPQSGYAMKEAGEVPLTTAAARERLSGDGKPVLIVFGTGWGLADSVLAAADAALEPITASAMTGYNHLSVRAAAAIILDRLLGLR
jgi:hypothetical protein